MNRLSNHLSPAEIAQFEADLAHDPQWAEDRRYRRKAWTACALGGFWIVLGAVVWMVVL